MNVFLADKTCNVVPHLGPGLGLEEVHHRRHCRATWNLPVDLHAVHEHQRGLDVADPGQPWRRSWKVGTGGVCGSQRGVLNVMH